MAYGTRPRFQAGVQRPRRDERPRESRELVLAAPAPRPETRRPNWNTSLLLDPLVELHRRQP